MNTNQIRQLFLDYFTAHGHEAVASSSLVPANDPTLLFTNAGMVQFKETFLGSEERPYSRATSSQRCVRAGGKHNDLENVGYTRRHHTYFEMLGNFSFGDYFKRAAIKYAWQFLTEVLKIDPKRLWITVFRDDKESEEIWLNEMKVDPKKFSRCGEKDNFWQMGETGPCGPCTEIFYDHGPEVEGGPPGSPQEDGDRYVEIWNIVFMQYDRNLSGKLTALPKPCVDTGMGLERIAAVMQGVHDNYDIDIFQHLLKALAEIVDYNDLTDKSMRVVVDHIRSVAFLIADGVIPSNEGRGYVLRRIIRRAIRHGHKLGQQEPFFYKLVAVLAEVMGGAYPELISSSALIEQVIQQEEEQFAKTLSKGLKRLDQEVAELDTDEIPGGVMFQLYDTYGFPPDLTADIARERGLKVDNAGFELAMQNQREQSQQSQQFNLDHTQRLHIVGETKFVGYDTLSSQANIIGILQDNKPVTTLSEGEKGIILLDRTPFYAESGGQVGDTGVIASDTARFQVEDTQKQGTAYLHIGHVVQGQFSNEELVQAQVNESLRAATVLNHSATHLLHEALRRILGEHVRQKGSLVEPRRLRFDFSHPKALTYQEVQSIERMVNEQIRINHHTSVSVMTPEEAKEFGALALFGERYGKQVRVLKMGDFSTEICGGTHAHHSGDIGLFKITSESACASGVRRIEAVTGEAALETVELTEEQLRDASDLLKTNTKNVNAKLKQVLDENRELERELNMLKQRMANQQMSSLKDEAIAVGDISVLAKELEGADRDTMRNILDSLKQQLPAVAIVLATVKDGDVQLVSGVSKDCLPFFNASQLLNQVAHQVGGKGGGRPEMAQGGGTNPQALKPALASVLEWVKNKVAQ